MAYRNLIAEANRTAYNRILSDKETIQKAYDRCALHFWSYCGIPRFMAHEEYLKAYDWYDEHKKIQGFAKRVFQWCDEDFDKYDKYLNEHMEKHALYLLNDFHNNVYKGLQKQLLDLTLTFKFYYERKGLTDIDVKAQITTTNALIAMAADLWHEYFKAYKEEYLVDFSKNYEYAKLDIAQRLFDELSEDVVKCKKLDLHPTKNYASVQAYNALCEKLVDDDFLDNNGYKALKLNHYDKEVKEIEQQQLGLDKLKEKFGSK